MQRAAVQVAELPSVEDVEKPGADSWEGHESAEAVDVPNVEVPVVRPVQEDSFREFDPESWDLEPVAVDPVAVGPAADVPLVDPWAARVVDGPAVVDQVAEVDAAVDDDRSSVGNLDLEEVLAADCSIDYEAGHVEDVRRARHRQQSSSPRRRLS